ncbi:DNA replication protein DnaC [Vibrio crassostreae]|uniref:ATP-binding protein n=1 Tax=Vibrio crassostreae TaxID=246167 RepID=UPI001B3032CE|nr:ATP-binding protein [Vibrio crassostreae]CAK1923615.1 DNA replication protein DnaC [Vibrio crassostreae]CAK2309046.1 DNA replication protein DnaC [Vibrio crassostreae]CAK2326686.1 DNA replication protein DnaC [Vibrio crassostreae]CAK3241714.1 DNA replication protein DnaC [Vibrio crassostreae]
MSVFQRIQQQYAAQSEAGTAKSRKQVLAEIEMRTKEAEQSQSKRIYLAHREQKMKNKIGRSGLGARHQDCSFENYEFPDPRQKRAWNLAKNYSLDPSTSSGFIFFGNSGTGKNHLAAAIAHNFMRSGRTALVITVSELVSTINDTYTKQGKSEFDVINYYCNLGLLVLDEIGRNLGMSPKSLEREKALIDEIVDRRSKLLKPTGFLSNLSIDGFKDYVGYRVVDRLSEDRPTICAFEWDSYRGRK